MKQICRMPGIAPKSKFNFAIKIFSTYILSYRKIFFKRLFSFLKSLFSWRKNGCALKDKFSGNIYLQKRAILLFIKLSKSRLSSSIMTFFNLQILIRDFLLKIHIFCKFGVSPLILHENRLFEYDFHISP